MSNPKFSVGDAVMTRHEKYPKENSDFSIVTEIVFFTKGQETGDGRRFRNDLICYTLNTHGVSCIPESELHPIPPEKGLTWNECAWKPSNNGVVA